MSLPSGLVTFLFTDIEGSTRLWEERPDAMRLVLARHDSLLRFCIESYGGLVFKTVGNSFCAVFTEPRGSTEAVLAAQKGLPALVFETEVGSEPLRVRMALHAGVAEERDGDYFGPTLNRIARLLSIAHGGQTILSLTASELVRDSLPDGATLRDMGEHRLKDLGLSERVFQLCHPDLPADFPPLRSLGNPQLLNNLPQQLTSFIGREKELAAVGELLGKTRLLTLAGSGGTGKTRLAMQAAAEMLDGSGIAMSLNNLAVMVNGQGDHSSARALHRQSLAINWELGSLMAVAISLEDLGSIAAALGDPLHAARLWGAMHRLRDEMGTPLPPDQVSIHEKDVAATRAALDDDAIFDQAWQEGRAITTEQAVEYALEE